MRAPLVLRHLGAGSATGLVGTAAMTTTTWGQTRMRQERDVPVDYDATGHVVTAAARVLRHEPRSHAEATAMFLLVHWGYGSAVATAHRLLVRRVGRPRAAVLFFTGCQAMAFVLLPVLGRTPPPWRWRRDVLVSSVAQHVVYVAAVALADRALADRAPADRAPADDDSDGGVGVDGEPA